MQMVAIVLAALVALLHLYFLVLEMFFWTKPLGRKAFGLEKDFADQGIDFFSSNVELGVRSRLSSSARRVIPC